MGITTVSEGEWSEDEEDFHERGQGIFLIFSRISSRWWCWNVCEFVLVSWPFRWIIKLGFFSVSSFSSSSAKSFIIAQQRSGFQSTGANLTHDGVASSLTIGLAIKCVWLESFFAINAAVCCLFRSCGSTLPALRRRRADQIPKKSNNSENSRWIEVASRKDKHIRTVAGWRVEAAKKNVISKLSEFQLKVFRVSATQTTDEKKKCK